MTEIDREVLLRNLDSVEAGLVKKDSIEQGSCFVFKDGDVFTFNDEVACRGRSGLPKKLVGAVKAKPLTEQLRKLPDERLEVVFGDGKLVLKGGKRRSVELLTEAEITLPVDAIEKPGAWTALPDGFGEAVGVVQQCAATKDDGSTFLNCVHVHPKWVEASDRLQLCRWRIKTGAARPMLVKRDAIGQVAALGMREMCETDNWLHFRNANGLVLSCLRYLDTFPDLGAHLKGGGGHKIRLPKGIPDAADRANVFSQEDADNNRVLVQLKPGRLTLTGTGTSGRYEETKKLGYDGPKLAFYIAPQLLGEIARRHEDKEFEVTADKLIVASDKFTYVACLVRPDELETVKTEKLAEVE